MIREAGQYMRSSPLAANPESAEDLTADSKLLTASASLLNTMPTEEILALLPAIKTYR